MMEKRTKLKATKLVKRKVELVLETFFTMPEYYHKYSFFVIRIGRYIYCASIGGEYDISKLSC